MTKVWVTVPTLDEVENLDTLVHRIRAAVDDAHILIVDDASSDGTAEKGDAHATNMAPATLHIVEDSDNAQDLPVFVRGNVDRKGPIAGAGEQTRRSVAIAWPELGPFHVRRGVRPGTKECTAVRRRQDPSPILESQPSDRHSASHCLRRRLVGEPRKRTRSQVP